MTNAEIIQAIKAEIDKLYGEYKDKFHQCGDQYHLGLIDGLDMAERVLDSLESGTTYDTHQYTPRPSVGIDDVARVQFASHAKVFDKKRKAVFDWEQFKEVAGIFYGFGKKDRSDTLESEKPMNPEEAMKELDEKIALVKRRGTWDGVDVDKYMDEVRGREPEKPKDLEEAANKFAVFYDQGTCDGIVQDCFIAGAKWQAEQLLKGSPLPEDIVLFNKGVEEGRRLAEEEQAELFTIVALDAAQRAQEQQYQKDRAEFAKLKAKEWSDGYDEGITKGKEQMMKKAVEGLFQNTPFPTICLDDCKDYNFKDNQKVRIIIVKED